MYPNSRIEMGDKESERTTVPLAVWSSLGPSTIEFAAKFFDLDLVELWSDQGSRETLECRYAYSSDPLLAKTVGNVVLATSLVLSSHSNQILHDSFAHLTSPHSSLSSTFRSSFRSLLSSSFHTHQAFAIGHIVSVAWHTLSPDLCSDAASSVDLCLWRTETRTVKSESFRTQIVVIYEDDSIDNKSPTRLYMVILLRRELEYNKAMLGFLHGLLSSVYIAGMLFPFSPFPSFIVSLNLINHLPLSFFPHFLFLFPLPLTSAPRERHVRLRQQPGRP